MDPAVLLLGLVMLVGLAGVLVPMLPGTALVLAAGLAWALLVADGGAGRWLVVAVMAALFAGGAVLKYVLPGRRMAGSLPRRTLAVAGLGAVVGFVLLPPLGALLGGVVGVYVAEHARLGASAPARRSTADVLRAVGLGMMLELGAGALMVTTWLVGLALV